MKKQIKTYKTFSYLKLICCIISKILLLLGGICIARNPKFVAGFKNSIFLLLASFIMHLIAVALESNCYGKCVVICMPSTLGFGLSHLCLFFLTAVMCFRTNAFFARYRDRFSDLSQKLSPH